MFSTYVCTLYIIQEEIMKAFSVGVFREYTPNYNIAPTQEGLVMTANEPETGV
jgi:putative SOS response-associated peptidase YedK